MFIPEGYNKDGKCQILLKGSTLIKFEVALDSISYNTQFPFPLEFVLISVCQLTLCN